MYGDDPVCISYGVLPPCVSMPVRVFTYSSSRCPNPSNHAEVPHPRAAPSLRRTRACLQPQQARLLLVSRSGTPQARAFLQAVASNSVIAVGLLLTKFCWLSSRKYLGLPMRMRAC